MEILWLFVIAGKLTNNIIILSQERRSREDSLDEKYI